MHLKTRPYDEKGHRADAEKRLALYRNGKTGLAVSEACLAHIPDLIITGCADAPPSKRGQQACGQAFLDKAFFREILKKNAIGMLSSPSA
jgi:hypothetical protein